MKKLKCLKCGKVIEGFTDKHVDSMMMQHNLKHEREEKEEASKK